jgi:hypothetical protein
MSKPCSDIPASARRKATLTIVPQVPSPERTCHVLFPKFFCTAASSDHPHHSPHATQRRAASTRDRAIESFGSQDERKTSAIVHAGASSSDNVYTARVAKQTGWRPRS